MHRLLPVVLLLAACSNKLDGSDHREPDDTDRGDADTADTDTGGGPVDHDGDGYFEGDGDDEDCDDYDAEIHPGAPERCNGIDDDCDGELSDDEVDQDGDGEPECEEICAPIPGSNGIPTRNECEFVPSPSGTPFSARIEWAMTHEIVDPSDGTVIPAYTFADEPDFTSVFQAPVVGQATDDDASGAVDADDRPDIAIVMADVAESTDGVLRLIDGDGSAVLASAHWQNFSNRNGTYDYAPYHYAGVAMANIDADAAVEILTLVIRQQDGLCYPAAYEVTQSGHTIDLALEQVYGGASYSCMAHAPSAADLDGDGRVEVIYGRAAFEGDDFSQKWYGAGGRGWYGQADYAGGYWNSGYHAFPYNVDGTGDIEVVAGKTVYKSDGTTFCELGSYSGSTWVAATDGYPAIADIARFNGDTVGEPEIVITGNEWVSVFHGTADYDPNGLARCVMVDQLPNDPLADSTVPSGLPSPAQCDATATSFGGPPTIADFDGDGENEIGVAGSCWYSVFELSRGSLERYALTNTRDWSSASTGSTVFDFNGDGASEVVFSDEQALYVWEVNTASNLDPWERLDEVLFDDNHKSWTIHEYPLVADVDADGKAEIVVVNSHLPPSNEDAYGIYVLGAADDDWVSSREVWPQHAYYVTNATDSGDLGTCDPNYAPYTAADYDSFRQQAPGEFGALEASNLRPTSKDLCQEGCGDVVLRVQVANDGLHVVADASTPVALYGLDRTGNATLLDVKPIGFDVAPGSESPGIEFTVPSSIWTLYSTFRVIVDDPEVTGFENGTANECDETDNMVEVAIDDVCP